MGFISRNSYLDTYRVRYSLFRPAWKSGACNGAIFTPQLPEATNQSSNTGLRATGYSPTVLPIQLDKRKVTPRRSS